MTRREFLTIAAFLGAQTLLPTPRFDRRSWNPLSKTQDLLSGELKFPLLHMPAGIRLLFFSPHPDDEVLAASGLIQRVIEDEGKVRVVYMTNGDGYVEGVRVSCDHADISAEDYIVYGNKRHDEAVKAIEALGLQQEDGCFLGFPDQGIDSLWKRFWSRLKPYTSPYTHFSSPDYRTSFERWKKYAGADLDGMIQEIITKFAPDWVVMPDPRDLHPDHSATGVFVINALRRLHEKDEFAVGDAQALTYLVHYPDYPVSNEWKGKVEKAGFSSSGEIARILADVDWVSMPLTADEVGKKQLAISDYKTQIQILGGFMKLFIRSGEAFGVLDTDLITRMPMI